jgi:nitrous oxide reductase accessory protein NosL
MQFYCKKTKDKLWCPNCGMNLVTFYKTSHAIKLKDGSFKQFCSMHCLVESLKKYKDKIVDILVVDAKTNKFINAKNGFYVVGSKIKGTMTKNSKYAFLNEEDAKKFQKKYGGKIVNFQEALKIAKLDFKKDMLLINTKRSKLVYKKGKKLYLKKCQKIDPNLYESISLMKADMKKNYVRWILALLITLSAAAYQRLTGPTYPVRGDIEIDGKVVSYKLLRSHGGETNQPVTLAFTDTSYKAYVFYKHYKTDEAWQKIPMQIKDGQLYAELPHQPPAGKIEYYLILQKNGRQHKLPEDVSVITRFKGAVPAYILVPHILFMFLAMLLSTRTGIEALDRNSNPRKLAFWTLGFLTIGGMILGPIVQQYAFGALWTGVPFGWDLTDNKTLIAFLGWIGAIWAGRGGRKANILMLGASLITLAVYLIPHSVMGSELKYE